MRGRRFLVPLNAENRAAAGVAAGEQVDVEIQAGQPEAFARKLRDVLDNDN